MWHVIFILFSPSEQRGGGALPDFLFYYFFLVQQTTSGIGHRVKADLDCGTCGAHGGYDTPEVRDA